MRLVLLATFLLAGPALAEDVDHGKAVFARACASCHQVAQPKNLVGPNLIGVVGRKIGGVEGFSYSTALKSADGVWDAARLNAYLENPGLMFKGSKMINKLPSETDRADVIAYLATIK